jgi:hypothetical protein
VPNAGTEMWHLRLTRSRGRPAPPPAALLAIVLLALVALLASAGPALASLSSDCFRSVASGNWNSTGTWESAPTLGGCSLWLPATLTPTSAASTITIRNGHTVTVTASVTVDQIVVSSGGQIIVNNGHTLTLANGAGTDLDISGTVSDSGTIAEGASVSTVVESGGTLNIPSTGSFTGAGGSAATKSVLTESAGGSMTVAGAISGSFSSWTFNGSVANTGTIGGNGGSDMTIGSTGSATSSAASGFFLGGGSTSSFSVSGTLSVTGTGTIVLTAVDATSNPMTVNSGGRIKLAPSAVVTSTVGGPFTLSGGADIEIGSAAGITSSGSTGNVQVAGTRSFSTGANYTYAGTAAQSTGTGLPATVNNLTINNSSGNVTLTGNVTVSGGLALTSGDLATGTNSVTEGTSATTSGTTDVVGNFIRTSPGTSSLTYGNPNNIIQTSASPGTQILVNLAKSAPSGKSDAVTRTYTITPNVATGYTATVQLHYLDGELNGNTESRLQLWRSGTAGGTFALEGRSSNDSTNNWVQQTSVAAATLNGVWTLAIGCDGGSLSLSAPGTLSFPTVTLNGTNQTRAASLVLTVDDQTASNSGWNVTGTSTTFTKAGGRTLPTTATSVTSASAAAATRNCSLPTSTIGYPATLPAGGLPPTPVKLYNASAGTGSGPTNVTLGFQIAIPANAYNGSYSSTWTFAIVSGP